jgi:3-phenylpropionate/trans-cinnamate dioxygenase ferredoxin subunit
MARHPLTPDRVPAPGERRYLFLGERRVVLFNLGGAFHAIDDTCPHQGASLFAGRLSGTNLRCPAHALCFDIASGEQVGGGLSLTRYPVETDGGAVAILVED